MSSRLGAGPVQLCIAVCLALCLGTALAATEPVRTLERIRSDGVIRLGYRSNATPFSFRERDGTVRGYSVELCDRIAAGIQKQLGLAKLKTEWTPLDAGDRLDAVVKGRVDIECGTTTISLSRYERVDFSLPTFVDGGSVLTTVDAKLTQLKDLGGKRVAVIPGTTTETALAARELAIVGATAELSRSPTPAGPRAGRLGQGRRICRRSHRADIAAGPQHEPGAIHPAGQRFFVRALRTRAAPRRPGFPAGGESRVDRNLS
jgi:ABC-type amino acid transport substrate-binding protein